MDPLSGAASVIAVVQLSGAIVQVCGKYLNSVKNATQDIQRLQERTVSLAQVLQSLHDLTNGPNASQVTNTQSLVNNITTCLAALTKLKQRLDPGTTQKGMRKWGLRAFKWPLTRPEVDAAIMDIESYKTTFTLCLQTDQMRSTTSAHQKLDLGRLETAKGAAFDSYDNQHDECLPGTRVDLLQEIETWMKSPDGKCLFWLNGMAGTGKSTIAQTVAKHLKEQELLGGSFFFARGEENRQSAKRLFPTLAEQLVVNMPQILPMVQNAIQSDPNISDKALREQFEKLLLEPLLAVDMENGKLERIVVIDALDECISERDTEIIIRILPQVQKSNSLKLRFLLTSRPELPIRLGFGDITGAYQDLVLHEVPHPIIKHDISLYVKHQFLDLKKRRPLQVGSDWPGDAAIESLIDKAVPLFIAAVTLCRFISDSNWSPQKRLKSILADEANYVSKVDSTYTPVLNQLLTGQDEQESKILLEEFKQIVGTIILVVNPLSINSLSQLLEIEPDDIKCRLDRLHSVLSVPNDLKTPVRLLHLSFRDFLLDPNKAQSRFWIDEKHANLYLLQQCIRTMNENLRKNICNLPHEGSLVVEIDKDSIGYYIPPGLEYACRHWPTHLLQSQDPAKTLLEVFPVIEENFLHWLEAMGMLKCISEVIVMIQRLTTSLATDHSAISRFLNDARRFVLKNRQIAEAAPLQIYSSSLMFAPMESIVRRKFQSELANWNQLPKVEDNWSADLQTLEGSNIRITSLAFSPDGQILASGSYGTIQLWDSNTGERHRFLEGDFGMVESMKFSPDGQVLVSGHKYGDAPVWDVSTGELLRVLPITFCENSSLGFSSNGRLLAAHSDGRNVSLWEEGTGELWRPLDGHSGLVTCMIFSPDGQALATGSRDGIVRLWDTHTKFWQEFNCHRQELNCQVHFKDVKSISFSNNNLLLASGNFDGTIQIWETSTVKLLQVLQVDHLSCSVMSLSFSMDDQLLASTADRGKDIRLWSTSTGVLHQVLTLDHSNTVDYVAFSPVGKLLASAADKKVKLWDIGKASPSLSQEAEESRFSSDDIMIFSSDGQLLACGYYRQAVQVWDTKAGKVRNTFEEVTNPLSMAFITPDNELLISNSGGKIMEGREDGTIETSQIPPQDPSIGLGVKVTFSPDGQLGAIYHNGRGIISIGNPNTGDIIDLGANETVELNPKSSSFSTDNKLLASGSSRFIHIWDVRTGELRRTFDMSPLGVRSFSISPDGNTLACCVKKSVELWDIQSGGLRETLRGHENWLWSEFNVGLSIFEKQWIFWRGKRFLWLPPDYRPRESREPHGPKNFMAFRAGTLAISLSPGKVCFVSGFV